MAEELIPTITPASAAADAYPADLARFVRDRWGDVPDAGSPNLLPDVATLEAFFSACFHASMLREEERAVTFRAILAPPELFPVAGRPPESLQRLDFWRPLPFHPNELRRLSVSADTQRTLIGVQLDADGVLRIWGLIQSGSRWLSDIQGGRRAGAPLPPAPVVQILAPGGVEVYKGYELVGKLRGGKLSGTRRDIFQSEWMHDAFTEFRNGLMARHEAARSKAHEPPGANWALLDQMLARRIAGRMMKRVIALLRDAHHGGTIVFFPRGNTSTESFCYDCYVELRYRFADGRTQFCFPDLIVDILNRLAQIYGGTDKDLGGQLSWKEFETTTDEELNTLDEALFEISAMIASLGAVDGVVALSKDHELLGFGGMISSTLPAVNRVARALDLEGDSLVDEDTGNVGARHNSAYRLAGALPGSLVIVISQDGGVRFICEREGRVIYWEQE